MEGALTGAISKNANEPPLMEGEQPKVINNPTSSRSQATNDHVEVIN